MEGMSPGAEFYTNLESIIESRKRYLDFNKAQTTRELQSQEMLNDCFVKHEKMISWLWNHISDLQLEITSLQEEAYPTMSPRRTSAASPPSKSFRQNHRPVPPLVRETPPERSARQECLMPPPQPPLPHRGSARPEPVIVPETPPEQPRPANHLPRPSPMREIEPQLQPSPELEDRRSPVISFSQRLLERKTECDKDDDAPRKRNGSSENNSDSSTFSNAATQPPPPLPIPHKQPDPRHAALPLQNEQAESAVDSSKIEPNQDVLIGSAVTPFRTIRKTGSASKSAKSVKRGSKKVSPLKPDTGSESQCVSTGRLKKKRQKRKRPRLQLEELEPEPEQTMTEVQDDVDGDTQGETVSRRKRLSSAVVTPKEALNKNPRVKTSSRRKRLSFATEAVTPKTVTKENPETRGSIDAAEAGSSTKTRQKSQYEPISKTLRIDGFKTPEAVDRAARAMQENFRRKEECAAMETVRGNARKALTGFSCHLCEKFFRDEAAGHPNPEAEYRRLVNLGCRHRAKKPPPSTPPNYWKLTFDETPTQPPS